jgi:SAM-dependent methyltransferase
VYPLLHLLDGRGPVLDFGCGGGHASFLMSRRVAGSSITCADVGFHGLFLTRQFLVGDANFICLDGDYPLPFASGYFSHVVSSDVVHWIDSKLGLAREFCRVVSWEGVIILPHLHNNLAPVRAGKSLSPAGYDGLFQDMERRLIPEDVLVDQFVTSGTVDLEKEWTREQLQAAANGLSLVASRNAAVFRRYDGLWQRCTDCMTPALNPLYEISGRRGKWNLSKPPAHSAGKPAPGDNLYLPHAVSLEVPYLDRQSLAGLKTADRRTFDELAKRFVLIDAPLSFSAFLLSVSLKSSWAATSRLLTSDLWGCVPDLLALAA